MFEKTLLRDISVIFADKLRDNPGKQKKRENWRHV